MDIRSAITKTSNGIVLSVRVVPRAGRSSIAGMRERSLLVRLAAAPVDGAANEALTMLLARALELPARSVTIASGGRSRSKRVAASGISAEVALRRLARSIGR